MTKILQLKTLPLQAHGWIGGASALIFLAAFFALTQTEPQSWNDISRIAAIESVVERGTWSIDGSSWLDETRDKVLLDGKYYSDKMPLLTLIAAAIYAPMRQVVGASLAPGAQPVCGYFWLTLILVGLPAALMIGIFTIYALRQSSFWSALVGALALGLGTMIFPYALVLNHHVPAAVVLFTSFFILLPRPRISSGWLVVAGLLDTLAISFDIITFITAAALVGIALVRYRSKFVYFALGAAIPLAVTALLDFQITGTLLPPYMIPGGYAYPDSAFPATFGGNGTPDDYAAYAFRMFLGGRGLFAYNPLLLLALVGAFVVLFNRRHTLRVEAFCVIFSFIAQALYLALFTGNYGGAAYGERWFVAAIPMLFAFIFFAPPLSAATWKNAGWVGFAPLLILSILSSLQGAQHPWQEILPPWQMTRDVNHLPIFGFKWNGTLP